MSSGRSESKGHLDLLILSVLARGPAHGYSVIQTLRTRSGGTFALPEGTVYPALHRLEATGLSSGSWEVSGGRRRRLYDLTEAGAAALADRREEWTRFSAGIDAVLGWTP